MLARPKFHFTEKIIRDVLDNIRSRGIYMDAERLDIELPDPKDRTILFTETARTTGGKGKEEEKRKV